MAETKTKTKTKKAIDYKINVEEMTAAGVLFGHKNSKTNPKMKPYIEKVRDTIAIIDLEETTEKLKEALSFIEDFVSQGKTVLFVGTKIPSRDLIEKIANECSAPFVNEKWIGGTFTNFTEISTRIKHMKDLEAEVVTREFEKHTKKEKIKIHHELTKLKKKFGGIEELKKLPDAIFVSDMQENILSIKEARKKEVKVIAIADTNADPTLCDYFIPANDDALSSLSYILERVKKAIIEGRSRIQKPTEESKE